MFSAPKFIIFGMTTSGEIVECFTWSRDLESGLAHAKQEAKLFNRTFSKVWGEPISSKENHME